MDYYYEEIIGFIKDGSSLDEILDYYSSEESFTKTEGW